MLFEQQGSFIPVGQSSPVMHPPGVSLDEFDDLLEVYEPSNMVDVLIETKEVRLLCHSQVRLPNRLWFNHSAPGSGFGVRLLPASLP